MNSNFDHYLVNYHIAYFKDIKIKSISLFKMLRQNLATRYNRYLDFDVTVLKHASFGASKFTITVQLKMTFKTILFYREDKEIDESDEGMYSFVISLKQVLIELYKFHRF